MCMHAWLFSTTSWQSVIASILCASQGLCAITCLHLLHICVPFFRSHSLALASVLPCVTNSIRCIFCGHGTYSPVSKVPYKYLSILLTSNPVSTSLSFLPASSRGGRSGETLLSGQMMWRVVPLAHAQQAFSPAHHLSGCLSICRWSGRCWFLVLLINPDFCLLPLSLQVLPWPFDFQCFP